MSPHYTALGALPGLIAYPWWSNHPAFAPLLHWMESDLFPILKQELKSLRGETDSEEGAGEAGDAYRATSAGYKEVDAYRVTSAGYKPRELRQDAYRVTSAGLKWTKLTFFPSEEAMTGPAKKREERGFTREERPSSFPSATAAAIYNSGLFGTLSRTSGCILLQNLLSTLMFWGVEVVGGGYVGREGSIILLGRYYSYTSRAAWGKLFLCILCMHKFVLIF